MPVRAATEPEDTGMGTCPCHRPPSIIKDGANREMATSAFAESAAKSTDFALRAGGSCDIIINSDNNSRPVLSYRTLRAAARKATSQEPLTCHADSPHLAAAAAGVS